MLNRLGANGPNASNPPAQAGGRVFSFGASLTECDGCGKTCYKCGQSNDSKSSVWCRACKAAYDKERRKNDPEKFAAWDKAAYWKNRDKRLAQNKAWCASNGERRKATYKVWYEANKDHKTDTHRQWVRKNAEHCRVKNSRYRALRFTKQAGDYTLADWECIIKKQRGRCALCGAKTKLTVDHIVPLSLGGV